MVRLTALVVRSMATSLAPPEMSGVPEPRLPTVQHPQRVAGIHVHALRGKNMRRGRGEVFRY